MDSLLFEYYFGTIQPKVPTKITKLSIYHLLPSIKNYTLAQELKTPSHYINGKRDINLHKIEGDDSDTIYFSRSIDLFPCSSCLQLQLMHFVRRKVKALL